MRILKRIFYCLFFFFGLYGMLLVGIDALLVHYHYLKSPAYVSALFITGILAFLLYDQLDELDHLKSIPRLPVEESK